MQGNVRPSDEEMGKNADASSPRGLVLTDKEVELRDALRQDVETLAGEIGERNLWLEPQLSAAADFIERSFAEAGHDVKHQCFDVGGITCCNLEVECPGREQPGDIVVIGAHYDSVAGSPGANDNGSAVAAMLALAREFAAARTARTLRFVGFTNEEPPFFKTEQMGSLVYARRCRRRNENVTAMLSLETIGYYTDEEGSQSYPFPFSLFYPSKGNFIGFVANVASRKLLRRVVKCFRRSVEFPSEAAAVPGFVTGVDWSDHWSFWRQGYPALMVTDTAPFRYPYYHSEADTPDKLSYDGLARVVTGLQAVVAELVGIE